MVILDTNIIIDYLRRIESGDAYLVKIAEKIGRKELAISVITIQELFEGKSTLNKYKEGNVWDTLTPLKIYPYTIEVAQLAGQIIRDFGVLEFADAAIAATAMINEGELFTLNQKDFKGIKDLKIYIL